MSGLQSKPMTHLVVAGLVGQNHAGLHSRVVGVDPPGDAAGPLVDVKEASHAVSGPVQVVQSNLNTQLKLSCRKFQI